MLDWCREDLLFHPLTREMVRMKWYVQLCRLGNWESHRKKTFPQCVWLNFDHAFEGNQITGREKTSWLWNSLLPPSPYVPTFPSPSPPKKKILYIAIISNFFCVLQSSQEKSKTMVKPNFFFFGGGGGKKDALWSRWKKWNFNFAQLLKWNNSINNNHYVPRAFLKNCTFKVFKSEKTQFGEIRQIRLSTLLPDSFSCRHQKLFK